MLLVQVEGGGQGALGLVCAHRAAAQQRIGALSSASGLCGGFGRELVKLKAASGDSGDAWLVEPDHYYQGRLSTARCSRRAIRAAQGCKKLLAGTTSATPDPSTGVIMASPKAAIVTGGPEGHTPPVEVEGGGPGALGLVCVHRVAARQRIGALFSASGGFAAVLAANWPSSRPSVAAQKMRGWWSLTITTKAGSVQPAMLGGATGPLPWGRWAV